MRVRWERVIGLIVLVAVLAFLWERAVYVSSIEAFINADIRNILSPISGHLRMEGVQIGQVLEVNEKVLEVYNSRVGDLGVFSVYHSLQHSVELIKMEIEQANISIAKLGKDLNTNEKLEKVGGVAQKVVNDIRYRLDALRSEVASKQDQLVHLNKSIAAIEEQLKLYRKNEIFMPVKGVVWAVFQKDKDFVKAGDIILQFIDVSQLWVVAFFKEKDSRYISLGTKVTVQDEAGYRQWPGEVEFIRRGQFLKEDIEMFYDEIAKPTKMTQENYISALIKINPSRIFSPREFYGYGHRVKVIGEKQNIFYHILMKIRDYTRRLLPA